MGDLITVGTKDTEGQAGAGPAISATESVADLLRYAEETDGLIDAAIRDAGDNSEVSTHLRAMKSDLQSTLSNLNSQNPKARISSVVALQISQQIAQVRSAVSIADDPETVQRRAEIQAELVEQARTAKAQQALLLSIEHMSDERRAKRYGELRIDENTQEVIFTLYRRRPGDSDATIVATASRVADYLQHNSDGMAIAALSDAASSSAKQAAYKDYIQTDNALSAMADAAVDSHQRKLRRAAVNRNLGADIRVERELKAHGSVSDETLSHAEDEQTQRLQHHYGAMYALLGQQEKVLIPQPGNVAAILSRRDEILAMDKQHLARIVAAREALASGKAGKGFADNELKDAAILNYSSLLITSDTVELLAENAASRDVEKSIMYAKGTGQDRVNAVRQALIKANPGYKNAPTKDLDKIIASTLATVDERGGAAALAQKTMQERDGIAADSSINYLNSFGTAYRIGTDGLSAFTGEDLDAKKAQKKGRDFGQGFTNFLDKTAVQMNVLDKKHAQLVGSTLGAVMGSVGTTLAYENELRRDHLMDQMVSAGWAAGGNKHAGDLFDHGGSIFDRAGDGKLSLEEVKSTLREAGITWEMVDSNHDGKINIQELNAAADKARSIINHEVAELKAAGFDKFEYKDILGTHSLFNQDGGAMTMDDIRKGLKAAGVDVNKYDADHDGVIEQRELVNAMNQAVKNKNATKVHSH